MAKMLAKWLNRRYLVMAKHYGTKKFGFDDASKFLKRNFNDSDQIVSLVLSEFKKAGWINIEIDPEDSRKRIYSLVMMYNDVALNELVVALKEEKE